jgi:hypothetical protein
LGIVLFVVIALVLPRVETPLRYSKLARMGETAVFSNGIIFLDYQIAARSTPVDKPLRFDLFWTSPYPQDRNYQASLQLVDTNGHSWSPKGTSRPREFRPPFNTQFWQPNQYAHDAHLLSALPGTPLGLYDVRLILFEKKTLVPTPLQEGQLSLSLGKIELLRPSSPPTLTDLEPQYQSNITWEPEAPLRLVGYDLDRAEARPGDPFALTLFWQAAGILLDDYYARLTLRPPVNAPPLVLDFPLTNDTFPTSKWLAGDVWRSQQTFHLPADLVSGSYRWELEICVEEKGCLLQTAVLGNLLSDTPHRLFTPPPIDLTVNTQFDQLATLLGANATWENDHLRTTLIWQADALLDTSYHVFVHLVDETGHIVAQSDSEPADWTRPTTGWLPNEYIVDEHQLPLPDELSSGPFSLHVGLYDVETGQRLPTETTDFATIPLPTP